MAVLSDLVPHTTAVHPKRRTFKRRRTDTSAGCALSVPPMSLRRAAAALHPPGLERRLVHAAQGGRLRLHQHPAPRPGRRAAFGSDPQPHPPRAGLGGKSEDEQDDEDEDDHDEEEDEEEEEEQEQEEDVEEDEEERRMRMTFSADEADDADGAARRRGSATARWRRSSRTSFPPRSSSCPSSCA
jgi:hypothetical protein